MLFRSLASALLFSTLALQLGAQTFPSKPVTIIMAVASGGPTDIEMRLYIKAMTELLGQPFLMDYKVGAGGVIGTAYVAKAQPDGYTVLLGSITTHGIGPHMYSKLPYDPVKDFAPICLYATMPMIMVANAQLPVKSVGELIALAKAKPNSISFASSGSGGAPHLVGELFKSVTGAPIQHVPYKGSAPGAADVAGGQVQLMFDALAPHLPHLKSGRTKVLAAISPQRLPVAPDAPTMTELGYPKVAASIWYGMMAPAATPRAIINKLNAESNRILVLADVKERLSGAGIDTAGGSPEVFAKFIGDEMAKWGPVVKASGAKAD